LRGHKSFIVILLLQALLLFSSLDLLAIWGDELFTMETVARPVNEIIPIAQRDIHPPLYFVLLHGWSQLPLPWHGVAALRAFSGLWALAASVILYLLWTRSAVALALFALSPCLLLYGRMARSYSMQTALALLTLGLLWKRRWIPAYIATMLLLYTHYVPGVAVLAAYVLVTRTRQSFFFSIAAVLGYLPWVLTLADALRRWGSASGFSARYMISGNPISEQIVKSGFGTVSLTIGETFFAASLILVPVMLLLILRGLRGVSWGLIAIGVAAAAIGYLGVSRWVSYPFIPARLLWLLPPIAMASARGLEGLRWRTTLLVLIGVSFASSDFLYFSQERFLNKSYAAPHREVAAKVNAGAGPGDLIVADAYNTDPQAFGYYLNGKAPYIPLDEEGVAKARSRLAAAKTVWIYSNTRDTSPGGATSAIRTEACAARPAGFDLFLSPYTSWERLAMQAMGVRPPLAYAYEIRKCAADPTTGPPRGIQ